LTLADKRAVLAWIQAQTCWDVRRVQAHVWEQYGVRYKSRQSYYALLKAARQSWKKTQHRHPDADVAQIAAKRAEIKKKHASKPRPSS
jgi:transposase